MKKTCYLITSFIFLPLLLSTVVIADTSEKAPDFSFKIDTGTLTLEALRGKVIYLDFWASWCVPCRKSFPWMNQMHTQYGDQGLFILAVNLDKNPDLVTKFLDKYPAKFEIAYDASGDSAEQYKVIGMPTSYIIDRQGNIVDIHLGFREKDKAALEEKIRSALMTENREI